MIISKHLRLKFVDYLLLNCKINLINIYNDARESTTSQMQSQSTNRDKLSLRNLLNMEPESLYKTNQL
jgi:hypothetical protein